jgi:trimethylamine--corrinoid protein Co-methyltransferase
VVVDEFVGMNRKLLAGIEVNRETLAVDAIAEVGPGGHFMTQDHTYNHLREQFRPTVLNRYGRDKWEEQGCMDTREKARRKALKLLGEHQVPVLPPDVAAKLDSAVSAFKEAVGG